MMYTIPIIIYFYNLKINLRNKHLSVFFVTLLGIDPAWFTAVQFQIMFIFGRSFYHQLCVCDRYRVWSVAAEDQCETQLQYHFHRQGRVKCQAAKRWHQAQQMSNWSKIYISCCNIVSGGSWLRWVLIEVCGGWFNNSDKMMWFYKEDSVFSF